ncbi:MAG: tripartite tricarboxylate transporter substrate binding protein [Betaproteobacteria bacterium]|nr:tripartite tricarboxylate transporter substrate binding protein [Betaproteobacteria bacterium]
MTSRIIAEPLAKALGGSVVVENRSGASGNIGMELAARAKPDGYTIVLNTTPIATNTTFFQKLTYDIQKNFTPVALVGRLPHVLVVHSNFKANTLAKLLAMIRAQPGKLNYASAGTGTNFHLAAELFKDMTNTNVLHVPYRGGGPALTDTLASQVDLSFPSLAAALPHIKSGRLRALGVTTEKRSSLLPEIPSINEVGVLGYDFTSWFAVLAPAGTPREIVLKLNAAINQVTATPSMVERFAREGLEPVATTPEGTGESIQRETSRYAKLIKERGITPD